MELTLQKKKELLKPGTIWQRKKNGKWERIYLESLHTKLLRVESGYVDIQTEFGLEPVKVSKFLADYEFLGWARIKITEICSDRNLIPLTLDPSKGAI